MLNGPEARRVDPIGSVVPLGATRTPDVASRQDHSSGFESVLELIERSKTARQGKIGDGG